VLDFMVKNNFLVKRVLYCLPLNLIIGWFRSRFTQRRWICASWDY